MYEKSSKLVGLRTNQSDFIARKAKNLLRLVLYLDSMSYTNVDEAAKMTLDNLIGTIGGHLHLFLGMSLLSFVEIIAFIVSKSGTFVFLYNAKAK